MVDALTWPPSGRVSRTSPVALVAEACQSPAEGGRQLALAEWPTAMEPNFVNNTFAPTSSPWRLGPILLSTPQVCCPEWTCGGVSSSAETGAGCNSNLMKPATWDPEAWLSCAARLYPASSNLTSVGRHLVTARLRVNHRRIYSQHQLARRL
jgi:hypothetical protein